MLGAEELEVVTEKAGIEQQQGAEIKLFPVLVLSRKIMGYFYIQNRILASNVLYSASYHYYMALSVIRVSEAK
jgi:hypothetical protein